MAKVSVDDLRAMYTGSICVYKNKPYYISAISPRYVAACVDMFTQREVEITMDETTFDPPRRIGFINIMGSVLYLTRIPVRRYKVGLCKENLNIQHLGVQYPQGAAQTIQAASGLKHISIADGMFGKYPTFAEARQLFKNGNTETVAIDHQFCITKDRSVFYKTQNVGLYPADAKTVYDIVFDKEHKHLITLLDNNHEKSI